MGLLKSGGAIPGAIGGAINPPTGLTPIQGLIHGLLSGIPSYRLFGTLTHAIQGTLGKFGDPANNPYNHPENFGGAPAAPAANGTTPSAGGWTIDKDGNLVQTPGAATGADPAAPATAAQPPAGSISIQDLLGNNRVWNSLRAPFDQTKQQFDFPGSAIGPLEGAPNPYDSTTPMGATNSLIGSNAPEGFASVFSDWVRGRNII